MGLTGGIGAGKSTVAGALADLGAVIVDADRIAREVVEPGSEGLAELEAAFGPDVIAADGSLDRAALAAKAFVDDESRLRLNSILHPRIGARTQEYVQAAPADAILVQDIPLIVESGLGPAFDLVVVVHVDEAERLRRLTEYRGMDEADVRARMAAQATVEQRWAAADVWLDNGGVPGAIVEDVRQLWIERLIPFERNISEQTGAVSAPDIVPANPEWPDQARRAIARLALATGGRALAIEHVGPTSVPGLSARDCLDVLVTVSDEATAAEISAELGGAGFPFDTTVVEPDLADLQARAAGGTYRLHRGCDPLRAIAVHLISPAD